MSTFEFIVGKVRQKLSRWNARKLSLAGRITLARLVLLSIPNHFMFTVQIPLTICKRLRKLLEILFGDLIERIERYPYFLGIDVVNL